MVARRTDLSGSLPVSLVVRHEIEAIQYVERVLGLPASLIETKLPLFLILVI